MVATVRILLLFAFPLLLLSAGLVEGQLPTSVTTPLERASPIFEDSGQELTSIHGNYSRDVAVGDLDGDGDLDAVVAQGGPGSPQDNVIWLNHGDGIFSEDEQAIGNGESASVALGDLDGDGDLDLFFSNGGFSGDTDDEIWLNQGGAQGGEAGSFARSQQLPNGRSFLGKLGDFDGDGDLDAVVAGETLQIWLNDGSGAFTPGPSLDYLVANDMALGDLDGDGDLDLVIAGEGNLFPSQIFWNDGSGTFTAGPTLITDGVNTGVGVAQLDGDGQLDIYFATSQGNVAWWNNGDQSFSASAPMGDENDSSVVLGDVDNDGDVDAFVTRRLFGEAGNGVWLNGGDRTFVASEDNLGSYTSLVAALADLDGDGDLDAFVANSGPNKVWLNRTNGGGDPEELVRPFNNNGQELDEWPTLDVAMGDLNGDGTVDAIVANFEGVKVWLNGVGETPVGRFDLAQEADETWASAVALGDVDGDGDLDVVTAFFGGPFNFRVWLNGEGGDPPGTFGAGQSVPEGPSNPDGVALADLDGDGTLDLVLASPFGSEVWFNDGAGHFSNSGQVLATATHVALGDVNSDGTLDLVLSGWEFTTTWLNGQAGEPGTFQLSQSFAEDARAVALGDLDGDGDLDAFLLFYDAQESRIWLNDGAGHLSDSGQRIKSVNSTDIALGDLNGDGDLDAFITTGGHEVESQSNLIWLNSGSGTGRITEQCLGSDISLTVALGDVDGDGDLDAFVGNDGPDQAWLNNEGEVCFCVVDWLLVLQNSIHQPQGVAELRAMGGALQTYLDLRDHLLIRTQSGQRYARLYDEHNAELFALVVADAALRDSALDLLEQWQPNLQQLLDGQGNDTVITVAQVQAMESFLTQLSAAASPSLQQLIQEERAQLPPRDELAGMSMSDVQHLLLNDKLFLPLVGGD